VVPFFAATIEGYILSLQEDGIPVPEDKLDALLLAV
jgi:hypothetical protein